MSTYRVYRSGDNCQQMLFPLCPRLVSLTGSLGLSPVNCGVGKAVAVMTGKSVGRSTRDSDLLLRPKFSMFPRRAALPATVLILHHSSPRQVSGASWRWNGNTMPYLVELGSCIFTLLRVTFCCGSTSKPLYFLWTLGTSLPRYFRYP